MQNRKLIVEFLKNALAIALCCLTMLSISVAVFNSIDSNSELTELELEDDTNDKEQFEENDSEGEKIGLNFKPYLDFLISNASSQNSCYLNLIIASLVKDIPSPPPDIV